MRNLSRRSIIAGIAVTAVATATPLSVAAPPLEVDDKGRRVVSMVDNYGERMRCYVSNTYHGHVVVVQDHVDGYQVIFSISSHAVQGHAVKLRGRITSVGEVFSVHATEHKERYEARGPWKLAPEDEDILALTMVGRHVTLVGNGVRCRGTVRTVRSETGLFTKVWVRNAITACVVRDGASRGNVVMLGGRDEDAVLSMNKEGPWRLAPEDHDILTATA